MYTTRTCNQSRRSWCFGVHSELFRAYTCTLILQQESRVSMCHCVRVFALVYLILSIVYRLFKDLCRMDCILVTDWPKSLAYASPIVCCCWYTARFVDIWCIHISLDIQCNNYRLYFRHSNIFSSGLATCHGSRCRGFAYEPRFGSINCVLAISVRNWNILSPAGAALDLGLRYANHPTRSFKPLPLKSPRGSFTPN